MDLRLDRPKIRSNHLPKVTAPLWRAGVPPVPTAQAPRSRKLLLSPPQPSSKIPHSKAPHSKFDIGSPEFDSHSPLSQG